MAVAPATRLITEPAANLVCFLYPFPPLLRRKQFIIFLFYFFLFCPTVNFCISSPCQNQGTCTNSGATYTCACKSNFKGTNCEIGKLFSLFSFFSTKKRRMGNNPETDYHLEIVTPTIDSVSPSVASSSGTNITVVGSNLESGLSVTMKKGSQTIFQQTFTTFTVSTKRSAQQSFSFMTPAITGSSAISLEFLNPSGGLTIFPGFYITENCATPGMYGPGNTCLPCPASAIW